MQNLDLITNGEMTAVIGGKKRTLKFGMLTFKLIESQAAAGNFDGMGTQIWAALMVRSSVNDLPTVFTVDTVLDWMDEMSDEDLSLAFALCQRVMSRVKNVEGRVSSLLGLSAPESLPTGKTSRQPGTK